MIPGFKFESDANEIEFLKGQLAATLALLQKYQGGEQAFVKQWEDKFQAERSHLRAEMQTRRDRIKRLEFSTLENAARYTFLRRFMVQVWKLGIASSDASLDAAIDAAMRERSDESVARFLTDQEVPSHCDAGSS